MHEGTAEYDITVYTIYGTIIYSCIHFSCIREFSNSRPVMKGLWHLVLGALLDDACRDEESGIQTKKGSGGTEICFLKMSTNCS